MRSIVIIIICIVNLLAFGCSNKSDRPDYEKLVQNELDKEVRNDSLFLGYELGMKKDEFYDYSWKLNKKGVVKQGHQNMTVEYQLDDNELPYEATMNFYPDFHEGKIYRMRTTIAYKGWAPWHEHLRADSLIYDVKSLLEEWHGKGFLKYQEPEIGLTFKKVDGNREIVISKSSDGITVNVLFTDLKARRENS